MAHEALRRRTAPATNGLVVGRRDRHHDNSSLMDLRPAGEGRNGRCAVSMVGARKKIEENETAALCGTAKEIAGQIRRALKQGGSAEHAAGVQWFFKEQIKSHGWYTAALRRAIRRCRREILREHDFQFLTEVADQLFSGLVLEEKIAVFSCLRHWTRNAAIASFGCSNRGSTGSAVGLIMTGWCII